MTNLTLKEKALFLLDLKRKNDMRYLEFCFRLMQRTGVAIAAIEDGIIKYSKGEV